MQNSTQNDLQNTTQYKEFKTITDPKKTTIVLKNLCVFTKKGQFFDKK